MIGYGMATSTMGNFRHDGGARVRLKDDGTAVIEAGTHDIGTGTQTVFTQIAADTLGIDPAKVSSYGAIRGCRRRARCMDRRRR